MRRKGENAAPLGMALMARNAAGTLEACLQSLRPHVQQIVVGVDETSTDRTAKIARKYADEVFPLKVSDWHECPHHGRVLAQHFGAARNETFKHLDPSLEWWGWVDADDVVQGFEGLNGYLSQRDPSVVGLWLSYEYGHVQGRANTVFYRERILRSRVGWDWEQRVHEVVKPKQAGPWAMWDGARMLHQERGHRTQDSVPRNQLLLEIDLEENPDNTRAMFYLGNGHFAAGNWPQAVEWYERTCEVGTNPYEVWQSYCYLSKVYLKLGDLDGALKAAFGAIDQNPDHPEPYWDVAAVYGAAGEDEKCVKWTMEARTKQKPPFFVFQNPLDYTFNNRVLVADSYGRLGRVHDALAELQQAYQALPDPQVGGAIQRYQGLLQAEQTAQAYVTLAKDEDEAVRLYEKLPPEVRQFGRVRDVAVPALLRQRPNTQPRIVFYCGRSYEEWYPGTLNTTGIGGSETAVVEVARRFASDGWRVDVYNGAGRYEGVYDGVGYWEPARYGVQEAEIFVSWRQPNVPSPASNGKHILWCHDLNYGPDARMRAGWDKVLGVSSWHATMLREYYAPDAPDGYFGYVPNGIDLTRFEQDVQKVPMQCLYASSPDRGLERLLHLWPQVVKAEPGATLKIAYGWENIDKAIGAGRRDLAAWKAHMEGLLERAPNVEWLGRIPQDQLARLHQKSYAWTYPSHFLEVSCITAMEAMAGGAVPVASAAGALKETVGGYGVLVTGQPHSRVWGDFYVLSLLGVLTNPDVRKPLEYGGRERAKAFTWDQSYAGHWNPLVESLLHGENMSQLPEAPRNGQVEAREKKALVPA